MRVGGTVGTVGTVGAGNFPDEFSVEKGKPRVVVRRVKKSSNFHDPWVGTDTTGPGEAVSAIG